MIDPKWAQKRVLAWFELHGRKQLPWQHDKTPYRVWISEIMLQQTQVATVIAYYQRFMARFPTIYSLAEAPQDDVLAYWAGLGYYSRARNLHETAKKLCAEYKGEFPHTVESVSEFKGIGRSTAGAILSLGAGIRAPILDGNVKRVLSRVAGIPYAEAPQLNEKTLWRLAESLTPETHFAPWNQAMMDIGATLCTRTKPLCSECPFTGQCKAEEEQDFARYPGKKASKKTPLRSCKVFLLCKPSGEILLQQRPPTGIWGGLWTLPEITPELSPAEQAEQWGFQLNALEKKPVLRHVFSHFRLDILPFSGVIADSSCRIMDAPSRWHTRAALLTLGMPAPIQKLIHTYLPE